MTQTEIDANVRSIALHCGNNTPSMIGMNIEKGNKVYKLLAKLFTIHTWNQWCLRYALGNKPRAKTLFMHPMGHLYVLAERTDVRTQPFRSSYEHEAKDVQCTKQLSSSYGFE
eukprot:377698_1